MSTIDELIAKYCPNGVEFKELGEIASIDTGIQLNKTSMSEFGKFPVINGGISQSGYYNSFNTEANTITISQGGASAGYVNFMKTKFWAGAHCFVIKITSEFISNKFVYYVLKNNQEKIMNAKLGAGIPGLNKKELTTFQIPIPPLPVQQEIVNILDKFTELVEELEEELKARRKQYEYYRNQLLSPVEVEGKWLMNGVEVEWKTLGEVCNIADNKRKPIKSSLRVAGTTPYYGANNIQDYVDGYTHDGEYVLLAEDGSTSLKNYSVQYATGKFWANNHVHVIKGLDEVLNRFLFHWFRNMNFIPFLSGGTRAKLTKAKMLELPIPIPPLSEQERIVEILDKFDSLVNDISIGLPAEIEARRKQYEYYRSKLLSFKPK